MLEASNLYKVRKVGTVNSDREHNRDILILLCYMTPYPNFQYSAWRHLYRQFIFSGSSQLPISKSLAGRTKNKEGCAYPSFFLRFSHCCCWTLRTVRECSQRHARGNGTKQLRIFAFCCFTRCFICIEEVAHKYASSALRLPWVYLAPITRK